MRFGFQLKKYVFNLQGTLFTVVTDKLRCPTHVHTHAHTHTHTHTHCSLSNTPSVTAIESCVCGKPWLPIHLQSMHSSIHPSSTRSSIHMSIALTGTHLFFTTSRPVVLKHAGGWEIITAANGRWADMASRERLAAGSSCCCRKTGGNPAALQARVS